MRTPTYYEFFAGGGMARAGLGVGWRCLFANDICEKKARAYIENWGAEDFLCADIDNVDVHQLPGSADLAWASFPCQDLSLAGAGAGLKGARSGVFWSFWRQMEALADEGRAPKLIVLENVIGILSSRQGTDFRDICAALADGGYLFGALIVDAVHFVPQSRPRVFIIAMRDDIQPPDAISNTGPCAAWSSPRLERAFDGLSERLRERWIWWRPRTPSGGPRALGDIIEQSPNSVPWDSPDETKKLLAMMSPVNRAKVKAAQAAGGVQVGALYRRTRIEAGERVQRAEVRFDGVAGCLRTPTGGSSRQRLLIVDGKRIRSRLISTREAARLMGLKDDYRLPQNYNEAYHLMGDGVIAPAVAHLRRHILDVLIAAGEAAARSAA